MSFGLDTASWLISGHVPGKSEVQLIDPDSISVADDVDLGGVDKDLSQTTDVSL